MVVARKKQVCGEHLKVCAVKPPLKVDMGQCRACAEVMEDFRFNLRRSTREVVYATDQFSKKSSNRPKSDQGYLSRSVASWLLESMV